MAEFALFNRLGLTVKRLDFVGGVRTVEPPGEVQPNTTLTWQSEDAGSVTYQVAPESDGRGAARRFTLAWAFDPTGAPTCRARDVGRGLKVTIARQGDGVRFVVARRGARRVPPPVPRLGGPLSRLAPLSAVIGAVLVGALLAGSVTVLANPFHLPLPKLPARGHVAQTATPTPSPTPTATTTTPSVPPRLAVSPAQGSTLTCSGSSVSYPAITVRNAGGQTLTWQGSTSTFKASVSPPSGSLGAGQSQTLQVRQPGPTSTAASVRIASNGGSATLAFSCQPSSSGGTTTTTPAPQLAVSPTQATVSCSGSSVSFPAITVRNAGGQTLTWQAQAQLVAGASVSPPSGSLGAGQSQTLQVRQPGPTTTAANVEIFSNAGNVVVQFTCGSPPPPPPTPPPTPHGNLTVSPNPLDLGDYCGDSFRSASITLSNIGNGPLTWSQSGSSGFSLYPSTGQLNAGQSGTVNVSGTKSNGSFDIAWQDSGGGNSNTVTVSTSCVAPPPPLPPQLTVSGINSLGQVYIECLQPATITVGNSGGQTLNWSIDSSGGNGAWASPASGIIAPGGQPQNVQIGGSPAVAGSNGQMTINSNGGTVSFTVIWDCMF